jgi:peptidoglycan/xylan/chitin deacetylase (PgdA/CDA1 family)
MIIIQIGGLLSKDTLWSISSGILFLLWLFFPAHRIITSTILLLHIPVVILGVINLRFGFFCKALFHKKEERHLLALTFDDGPDPNCTPHVLDLLDKYNFKATFFVVGTKAQQHPELCKEIVKKGHVIGCHDLNHSITSNFRLSKQMTREIKIAQKIIESIIDKKPLFYRPPVGLSNPHLRTALKTLQMKCIGWSRSVGDAGNRRVHTFRNFYSMSKPGSVILLHDVLPVPEYKEIFFKELEILFAQIQKKNFSSVTIDRLFSEQAYG